MTSRPPPFYPCKLWAVLIATQEYIHSNEITSGSTNPSKRCREAQASVAFLWFAWAGFAVSLVLSILQSRRAGANLRPRVGPARGSRPGMSQV